jgi:hypothetical protein
MNLFLRWVLPIAILAVGIAIFTGALLPQLPRGTGLRTLLGLVVMLFGIYRFAAARMQNVPSHRRFGGEHPRPWER